jgi:DNA polymerase III gamma/tau subunit
MSVSAKGRYKIYIIDEVHMLTREATNALKIEEPPAHIILFATTELINSGDHSSRCQRYDFKRIPFNEIATSLKGLFKKSRSRSSGGFFIARASKARDAELVRPGHPLHGGKHPR